jgi:hypothetical protein
MLQGESGRLKKSPGAAREQEYCCEIDGENRKISDPTISQKGQSLGRENVKYGHVQQIKTEADFPGVTQPRCG